MIGFSFLGDRGLSIDAVLLLLLSAFAAGVVRSRWRRGDRSASLALGLAGGGVFGLVADAWWIEREMLRPLLLFLPFASGLGATAFGALSDRALRIGTNVVALAALNGLPIPLFRALEDRAGSAPVELRRATSPDGRFVAVLLRISTSSDGVEDRVVLRPRQPLRAPTTWPERTVLLTGGSGDVVDLRWSGAARLEVALLDGATVTDRVRSTHDVEIVPVRDRTSWLRASLPFP